MLRILYPNKYDRSNQHVSFLTHGWFPFVKRLFLEYLSAPCHSISLWCDVSQQTYDFLGSTNTVLLFPLFGTPWWRFSKGWSLKTVHFSGIFGIQLIVNVQYWILMASAVYKNLEQLLKISNQVECHESGMSRSNSKKSYVDVQTLYNYYLLNCVRLQNACVVFCIFSDSTPSTGIGHCFTAQSIGCHPCGGSTKRWHN